MSHPTHKTTKNMESGVKELTFTSPTKDFPTINLKEDIDVNFPSPMNGVTHEAQPMSHELNEVAMNGVTDEAQPMFHKSNDVANNGSEVVRTFTRVCHIIRPMEGGTM